MSAAFNNLMANDNGDGLDVAELSEFIKDQLYFMTLANHNGSSIPSKSLLHWKTTLNDKNVFYLNVDDKLVYDNFYSDFGPLNLAMIYRYIGIIREKLKVHTTVVHCSHMSDQKKRSNAAFLICAYMVIELEWTAHQAYTVLSQQYQYKYLPFRDASCLLHSEYSITVENCINALYKAKWFGFFNFSDFDVNEYEKYETVKFGDLNWIVPGTMLAFSTPHNRDYTDKSGYQIHSPAFYYKYFKENNIKHVVRLNSKKTYDAKCTFVAVANIQHTDMFFTDGTTPTDLILTAFLRLCEQYVDDGSDFESTSDEVNKQHLVTSNQNQNDVCAAKCTGAVAIHCKAGLGRTGCLIAAYIVKHWSFTAVEAIAWTRICRPGSVIGVQQEWLINQQEHLKTVGKQWQEKRKLTIGKHKRFINGVYSIKRHASSSNAYYFVDPPSYELLSSADSNEKQSLSRGSDSSEVKFKEFNQSRLSSIVKKKFKHNNHVLDNVSDIPNSRHIATRKNEDSTSHDGPSLKKNSRRSTSATIPINKKSTVKKNNTTSSVAATTINSSKVYMDEKKITKSISLNKTNKRIIRGSKTTMDETKITDQSKPSYALATVASAARMSRRIRSQNTK